MVSVWGIKLAMKIRASILFAWLSITALIALLPAISLVFQKKAIDILSHYIQTGNNSFYDILMPIIFLGIAMFFMGVSTRLNSDLLYTVMYDDFYIGMEEFIMNCSNKIELMEFHNKDFADEYRAILSRSGSLTDFLSSFCVLISKIITLLSLLVVALGISWIVFFTILLYIIVIICIDLVLADKVRADTHRIRDAEREAEYVQHKVMNLGTAKEIRIYNSGEKFIEQWNRAYNKVKQYDVLSVLKRITLEFVGGFGGYICVAILLLVSLRQISAGISSVGAFLMLYTLGDNLSSAVQVLTRSILGVDKGLFALERQHKFALKIKPITSQQPPNFLTDKSQSDIVFEARDVSFSYDGLHNVLDSINFKIHKGETIALVGANGSGKSTLAKLLAGLYQPTSGELLLNGVPYKNYSHDEIAKQIGLVFQEFQTFHLPMRENIGFGNIDNIYNEDAIMTAIKKGNATSIFNKLPNGLDTWLLKTLKKDGVALSGGEKQRVAMARGYMANKPMLIFDEPAAALDPLAEMEQFNNIKDKTTGQTAILISHRVGFARLANRIFTLDHGRLVETGTHAELLENKGVYANFYNSQAKWYCG